MKLKKNIETKWQNFKNKDIKSVEKFKDFFRKLLSKIQWISKNIDVKNFIIGILLACVIFLSIGLFNSGIGRYQMGKNFYEIIDTKTGILKKITPETVIELNYINEKFIVRNPKGKK